MKYFWESNDANMHFLKCEQCASRWQWHARVIRYSIILVSYVGADCNERVKSDYYSDKPVEQIKEELLQYFMNGEER